jgi:hypothetical protein
MLLETYRGDYMDVSISDIQAMSREELVMHLELRGTACYDDESTELLRQAAIEDLENELL